MKGSFENAEKRSHPRFVIDLPVEYREMGDSCLRGGIVVDVSGGGLLLETVRDIPVGTELNVSVLFPKGYELANFEVVTKIVRKKPHWKEDSKGSPYWEGFQYGLKFIQILEENRWKLDVLLAWTV
ncbi:MAG TPA: PilZ domain-containing protein [Thermodesulfobacteriota bacterium]|nr:PilZ domain-containing protein [Thermodesulfobacteriota bacterium]